LTLSVFLKLYGVAVVAFFLIDMAWLGVVARSFYRAQMGHLMRANVNWAAAIVFYLVFVSGIVVLVVWPAIQRQSPGHALVLGALFGLVTYAAYDWPSWIWYGEWFCAHPSVASPIWRRRNWTPRREYTPVSFCVYAGKRPLDPSV
jgi:uncharacterized membrane protein